MRRISVDWVVSEQRIELRGFGNLQGLGRRAHAGSTEQGRRAPIAADKEVYERQMEVTDREIDALVYELYGLREEEIGIVEERG